MKIAALTFASGATATLQSTLGAMGMMNNQPVNLWSAVVPFALLVSGIGTTIFLTWKVSGWVHRLKDHEKRLRDLEHGGTP